MNLLTIYSEVEGTSIEKVINEMSGKQYSYLKSKLAELLIKEICPVGKEIERLMKEKPFLIDTLKKGTEKAKIIS